MKSIHIKKLWRGAVFALEYDPDGKKKTVFYHCDYITANQIDFTCLHTDKEYSKKLYDRFVWLR